MSPGPPTPADPPHPARPADPGPPGESVPGTPGDTPRTTRLTGRAALLAVVICVIALSLAYPVREYVAQRQTIDQLVATQQAMRAQVRSLEAQHAQLQDPAYIEQQARQMLHMCFPGTDCYVVENGQPLIGGAPAQRHAAAPWYAKLWQSVKQADQNAPN